MTIRDPLDEMQQTQLHLECWKFFEHMQSLLPSPSFFAGADQGATSNDAWIQTSGAFRCHLMPSRVWIRPRIPKTQKPSKQRDLKSVSAFCTGCKTDDNTLWTSHDHQTISVTAFQSAGFRKDSRIKSPKMASNGAPRVQSTRK